MAKEPMELSYVRVAEEEPLLDDPVNELATLRGEGRA